MSENAEIVADLDCPPDLASEVAGRVTAWLVASGVVVPAVDDCALGPGHRPGPNAESTTGGVRPPDLVTNGVAVVVGRTVHGAGGNGIELQCPACREAFEPGDDWYSAVEEWWEGTSVAVYACPVCEHPQSVVEWDGPRPWALAHLAVAFWNWPPLSDRFVGRLAEQFTGRARVVHRHL